MTRFQLSILLATFGAFGALSACGADEGGDSECSAGAASCGLDASGAPVSTGAEAGAATSSAGEAGALPGTTGGTGMPGAGTTTGSGTTDGGTQAGGGSAAGANAGGVMVGGRADAGVPGGTGAGDGGGAMLPVVTGGTEPKIPEISGDCPEFKDGTTVMVAGHRGILLDVGEPNKKGPLYFFFHGTNGRAANVSQVPASIRNEIVQMGGIIASFNGPDSSQAEGDCSGTRAHNIADFKAADQIVACAVKNHGIDPRRIYVTGCSAGGLQSGCMAQLRSSYIAASAPNSGGVVTSQRWQDGGKPAIFTMHGPPGAGNDMVGVNFSDTSRRLDQSAKEHGSFVVNCNHGGGHCRAPAALYEASWAFMKDHPYGVDSPWKNGLPQDKRVPDYCMVF